MNFVDFRGSELWDLDLYLLVMLLILLRNTDYTMLRLPFINFAKISATLMSIAGLLLCATANGQYFQQDVVYDIEAALDSSHVITAQTDITYTNNSAIALDTIYLHLWANAFSDRLSAYSEQAIRLGDLDFYFAPEEHLGGYRDLRITIDGSTMDVYSWQGHKDVVYFTLPKSLETGKSKTIKTSYELRLPKNFSRMGWKKHEDYLMYWYPCVAVYDQDGWHPMPYLNMGESYTEISDYNISLTTDAKSIIASSAGYDQIGNNYTFAAKDLIDFAIVTSKKKKVYSSKIKSVNGKMIDIRVMTADSARHSALMVYLSDALPYFEDLIGPYPHASLSILDKGAASTSGMEYPGLITVSGHDDKNSNLQYYLVHELLHQYFYSALAFDQRDYAWLDEGLTTHYQQRYYQEVLDRDHYSQAVKRMMHDDQQPVLQSLARGQACRHYHAPLSTPAHKIDPVNFGLNAYEVPARMYAYLADYIGISTWDEAIRTYYSTWSGKHPTASDLQKTLESTSGKTLNWFFAELITADWSYDYAISEISQAGLEIKHNSGSHPPYKITLSSSANEDIKEMWYDGHHGAVIHDLPAGDWDRAILDKEQLSMDLDQNNNSQGIRRPIKFVPLAKLDDGRYREIYGAPILTYNTSDGAQVGLALYNSTFPTKKLKWAIAPSYGFQSGKAVGEGWISYDHYLSQPKLRKLQYKLNAKTYSFRNSETLDLALRYTRISPHVSLHMHHDPIDHKYSKIYFKPILLNEEFFVFQEENVSIDNRASTILRLGYEYYDFWKLGPMEANIQLEYQPYNNVIGEAHQYTKLTASLSKSYKFAANRAFDIRVWGAYFLTNSQRESTNYDGAITRGSSALIYQGFNDYAYDDYFFNRQNQDVNLSNQISYAGGGFKTPLGSQYGIGQTNDLALALNLKSDLPISMPKFLPLKLFLDVGYYRTKDTSEQALEGRKLISGGALLEYGEGLFSIYLPLFNSQEISQIYEAEGKGLLGKISFKIDLVRFNPWDIAEDYSF